MLASGTSVVPLSISEACPSYCIRVASLVPAVGLVEAGWADALLPQYRALAYLSSHR